MELQIAKTKLYKLSGPFNNWKDEAVEFDMFRKLASCDTATNSPMEHKLAAYELLLNRVYQLLYHHKNNNKRSAL
jgi:hypothetical protein